ncbi:contactin-1a-like [Clarias gariepinus]
MDHLADFLGHDIRVHRDYYSLPEGTFHLVKIEDLAVDSGASDTEDEDHEMPPTIVNLGPSDVSALLGAELILTCHAEGTLTPQISWMRNGVKLDTTEHVQISPVQLSDSGLYTCVARSKAGFAEQQFQPKGFGPCRGEAHRASGAWSEVVTLVCEAHGVPPPTLTWMKDSEPLSLHQTMLLHNAGEPRFQLLNVQREDLGFYTSFPAGTSTKTFNLTVLEPPKISSSPKGEELMVAVNGVLELECVADIFPAPTVSGIKGGCP